MNLSALGQNRNLVAAEPAVLVKKTKIETMKLKTMFSGLLAIELSGLTASACLVQVRVACPNDTTAKGIKVCIAGSITGCAYTDDLGIVSLLVPTVGNYTVCVDPSTLPAGAKLNPNCKN